MIEVKELTKYYDNHLAVDHISFTIEKGKVYGFLGPNGAGKSTTMNIITGCLAATSGQVLIGGHDIFEEPKEAKKLIGYLPELPPLYLDATVEEYLEFVAEARGVKKEDLQKNIDYAISVTRIKEYRNRLIRHLSKGYRQRVGIAQALLGNPDVIILDEPTVGLDPEQIIEIRQLIKDLGIDHTVILSSHILSEVQAICEQVIIIAKGKLLANDTPENLEKQFSEGCSVLMNLEGTEENCSDFCEVLQNEGLQVSKETLMENMFQVRAFMETADENEMYRKLFNLAVEKNLTVLQSKTEKADLEDIFIRLTEEANADADGDEETVSDDEAVEYADEEETGSADNAISAEENKEKEEM